MNTTGERIKFIRESMDLSQDKFGALVSIGAKTVKKGTVSTWEKDVNTPGGIYLLGMEEKTKFSARWILTGSQPQMAADFYLENIAEKEFIECQLKKHGTEGVKKLINEFLTYI